MTWLIYLAALWPLVSVVTAIAICREFHRAKRIDQHTGVFIA